MSISRRYGLQYGVNKRNLKADLRKKMEGMCLELKENLFTNRKTNHTS
jgi:hypothetical protein